MGGSLSVAKEKSFDIELLTRNLFACTELTTETKEDATNYKPGAAKAAKQRMVLETVDPGGEQP